MSNEFEKQRRRQESRERRDPSIEAAIRLGTKMVNQAEQEHELAGNPELITEIPEHLRARKKPDLKPVQQLITSEDVPGRNNENDG